jgi:hypothetical protein
MSLACGVRMTKKDNRDEAVEAFEKGLENTGKGSGLTGGPTPGEPGHDGEEGDAGDLGDTDYSPIIGNVIPQEPEKP